MAGAPTVAPGGCANTLVGYLADLAFGKEFLLGTNRWASTKELNALETTMRQLGFQTDVGGALSMIRQNRKHQRERAAAKSAKT